MKIKVHTILIFYLSFDFLFSNVYTLSMNVTWDNEKNRALKKERNVCFEEVEVAILEERIIDIIPHFNTERYPHQEIMIIELKNYVYYVPFVLDGDTLFLKTIIPSRKYNKQYKGNR